MRDLFVGEVDMKDLPPFDGSDTCARELKRRIVAHYLAEGHDAEKAFRMAVSIFASAFSTWDGIPIPGVTEE
jgi:hypothetical protein